MSRLGYQRFLAQGSDWGTRVSTGLALQHPGRLLGIHLVPPLAAPPAISPAANAPRWPTWTNAAAPDHLVVADVAADGLAWSSQAQVSQPIPSPSRSRP